MQPTIHDTLARLKLEEAKVAIMIVDHGSRRTESNSMLEEVVAMFRRVSGHQIIEPAHMELAEPSIDTAFQRAVEQGATLVVVMPYFLLPGRHWHRDIPALAAAAADRHAHLRHLVTAPLAVHDAMAQIMAQRIQDCLNHAVGGQHECELCMGTGGCQLK